MPRAGNSAPTPPAEWPAAVAVLAGGRDGPAAGYVVLATKTGTGFSSLGETALTTWEGPGTAGLRFFVRDLDGGAFWSPGRVGAALIEARGTPGSFTLEHTENGVRVTVETCVLADRPAELRRITLADLSGTARRLEVTSLAEVVLNHPEAHASHPSFSKLFLQTEHVASERSILVHRRPLDPNQTHPTLIHALLERGEVEVETDRARFHGRGHHPERPEALLSFDALSGTTGNVLDPVVSLRRKLTIAAGGSATTTFLLGAAADAPSARALSAALDETQAIDRAFTAARAEGARRLAELGTSAAEHAYAQHLAAAILRRDPGLRAEPAVLARAGGDPAGLADLGIEPRRPLAIVRSDRATTERMGRIFRSWRSLDLPIQLAVLTDDEAVACREPGSIHLRPGELTPLRMDLLLATAALVITDSPPALTALDPPAAAAPSPGHSPVAEEPFAKNLGFYNGWLQPGRARVRHPRHQ